MLRLKGKHGFWIEEHALRLPGEPNDFTLPPLFSGYPGAFASEAQNEAAARVMFLLTEHCGQWAGFALSRLTEQLHAELALRGQIAIAVEENAKAQQEFDHALAWWELWQTVTFGWYGRRNPSPTEPKLKPVPSGAALPEHTTATSHAFLAQGARELVSIGCLREIEGPAAEPMETNLVYFPTMILLERLERWLRPPGVGCR